MTQPNAEHSRTGSGAIQQTASSHTTTPISLLLASKAYGKEPRCWLAGYTTPDLACLIGEWRSGKGKRPVGAYAGHGMPLITSPGAARRAIYIPAYRNLVEHWLLDEEVISWVQQAIEYNGSVYLRDHYTGRGVDRNGPMSHAWLLCEFLNHSVWPT